MASGLLQSLRGQKEPLLPSKAFSEDGYTSDLETSPEMSFLNRPVPATANPIASDTHRRVEFRNDLRHHPDRGAGFYEYSRERFTRASLVSTGRQAFKKTEVAGHEQLIASGSRSEIASNYFCIKPEKLLGLRF